MSALHPESVRAIARKDFQDAVRSWLFWGLSVFFFTVLAIVTAVTWYFAGDAILVEELTTDVLIGLVGEVTRLVIPVIGLILGWKAIAGERESGSMKVLLSLPHSRTDVVIGKLVGRSLVLSLSLVLGFALGAVVVAVFMGRFGVMAYLGLLAMSIIYGVAYVSIAVAISSLTRSTTIAGAGIFGVFVLFYVVWNALIQAIELLVFFGYIDGVIYTVEMNGEEFPAQRLPTWAFLLERLDPGAAYGTGLSLVSPAVEATTTEAYEAMFDGSVPFVLADWFGLVILFAWVVLPAAIAVYWFDRADL